MRISDWSSDVCSSDLAATRTCSTPTGSTTSTRRRPSTSTPSGAESTPVDACPATRDIDASSQYRVGPILGGERQGDAEGREIRHKSARAERRAGRSRHVVAADAGRYRGDRPGAAAGSGRSEEHTSELQSLMRISYAV